MNLPAPVVVFDFDGTLTRWDTTARFLRWRIRRSAWRLALTWIVLVLGSPLFALRRTRSWPIRCVVWIATLGLRLDDLPGSFEHYLGTLPGGATAVFRPDALARLRQHLARGERVVIATGCVESIARVLLAQVELGDVPLVASTLRPRCGGLAAARHCHGRTKLVMLAERGFAPPWAAVYTDHHADLPLLAGARQGYLVAPNDKTRNHVRRKLDVPSEMLDWP